MAGSRFRTAAGSEPRFTPAAPPRVTVRLGLEAATGEALTIEVRQEQHYAIVAAAGEIDISTVTRLRERLSR
jgi:hypothetical protein